MNVRPPFFLPSAAQGENRDEIAGSEARPKPVADADASCLPEPELGFDPAELERLLGDNAEDIFATLEPAITDADQGVALGDPPSAAILPVVAPPQVPGALQDLLVPGWQTTAASAIIDVAPAPAVDLQGTRLLQRGLPTPMSTPMSTTAAWARSRGGFPPPAPLSRAPWPPPRPSQLGLSSADALGSYHPTAAAPVLNLAPPSGAFQAPGNACWRGFAPPWQGAGAFAGPPPPRLVLGRGAFRLGPVRPPAVTLSPRKRKRAGTPNQPREMRPQPAPRKKRRHHVVRNVTEWRTACEAHRVSNAPALAATLEAAARSAALASFSVGQAGTMIAERLEIATGLFAAGGVGGRKIMICHAGQWVEAYEIAGGERLYCSRRFGKGSYGRAKLVMDATGRPKLGKTLRFVGRPGERKTFVSTVDQIVAEFRSIQRQDPTAQMVVCPLNGKVLIVSDTLAVCDLQTMRHAIRRRPAAERCRILRYLLEQMVEALLRSCPQGWVHGDLKLNNIVYKSGRVWVIDWGLACSSPRRKLYTREYRPPELILGQPHVFGRLDVFALGVTALGLVGSFGRPSKAAERWLPLLVAERAVAIERLIREVEGADPDLGPLLRSMTAPDPRQRPALAPLLERLRSHTYDRDAVVATLDQIVQPQHEAQARSVETLGQSAAAVAGAPATAVQAVVLRPKRLRSVRCADLVAPRADDT